MLAGPSTKRKRETYAENESDNFSDVDAGSAFSEGSDEVDISSALTGKKPKRDRGVRAPKSRRKGDKVEELGASSAGEDVEDDDDGLQEIIQQSIAKRNQKSGTELLKKTKGKAKIVKGEVGGGSFQSMGTSV